MRQLLSVSVFDAEMEMNGVPADYLCLARTDKLIALIEFCTQASGALFEVA